MFAFNPIILRGYIISIRRVYSLWHAAADNNLGWFWLSTLFRKECSGAITATQTQPNCKKTSLFLQSFLFFSVHSIQSQAFIVAHHTRHSSKTNKYRYSRQKAPVFFVVYEANRCERGQSQGDKLRGINANFGFYSHLINIVETRFSC